MHTDKGWESTSDIKLKCYDNHEYGLHKECNGCIFGKDCRIKTEVAYPPNKHRFELYDKRGREGLVLMGKSEIAIERELHKLKEEV